MKSYRIASLLGVSLAASVSACAIDTSDEPDTDSVEQGLAPQICPAIAILCLPGYQAKQLPNCRQICVPAQEPKSAEPCAVGGCSGELCYDPSLGDGISICIWKPEYACYQSASCERQSSGACGWTMTAELSSCLASGGGETLGFE
jgi:hypothetical protein